MPSAHSFLSTGRSKIGYYRQGAGPGLILIHGALSSALNYRRLAEILAKDFTVYSIDRRGRGLSGPQGIEYTINKEIDDINELQKRTGAIYLFGHSFGGLVALETALTNLSIQKVAVYEPGISINGSISTVWMRDYERYLAEDRALDALTVFSRGTGPTQAKKMPHWLMKFLLILIIKKTKRKQMYDLLEENLREHQEVAKKDSSYLNYRKLSAGVLFLAGGKSKLDFVDQAANVLPGIIPSIQVRTLPGLNHFGPDQSGPETVAANIKTFLLPKGLCE